MCAYLYIYQFIPVRSLMYTINPVLSMIALTLSFILISCNALLIFNNKLLSTMSSIPRYVYQVFVLIRIKEFLEKYTV
jgi:hypothetical protein